MRNVKNFNNLNHKEVSAYNEAKSQLPNPDSYEDYSYTSIQGKYTVVFKKVAKKGGQFFKWVFETIFSV